MGYRIEYEDRHFRLFIDYDPRFLEELKKLVPYPFRYWNIHEKCWVINLDYVEDVEELVRDYFLDDYSCDDVDEDDGTDWKAAARKLQSEVTRLKELLFSNGGNQASDSDWGKIKVFMNKEAFNSLRRILAKQYHPDFGGSEEKMKTINSLFDKIEKSV